MDMLDSRALHYIDCYMQKFSKPGTVRYHLTTAAGMCLPVEKDGPLTIEVKERGGRRDRDGQQHNVTVSRQGNRLVAEPPRLQIEAGDAVLWHAPDPNITGWMVRGEGDAG